MSKFEDRVRQVVQSEIADIHQLFIDDLRDGAAARGIQLGFGLEGAKPEIANIEHKQVLDEVMEYLPQHIHTPEDDEQLRKFMQEMPPADADDSVFDDWVKRFTEWLDAHNIDVDVNINAPFSGQSKKGMLGILTRILGALLPVGWQKFVALLSSYLADIIDNVGQWISDIIMGYMISRILNKVKSLDEKILKLEREVNDGFSGVETEVKKISGVKGDTENIVRILEQSSPETTSNNTLTMLSELRAVRAEMDDIRRLLRRAAGYSCDESTGEAVAISGTEY